MPTNVVKTKADERRWRRAKRSAAAQGHTEDWRYIMGTFEHMKDNAAKGDTRKPRPKRAKRQS